MNMTPTNVLATVALVLAVVGIIRPAWPCTAVAVILLAVAVMLR